MAGYNEIKMVRVRIVGTTGNLTFLPLKDNDDVPYMYGDIQVSEDVVKRWDEAEQAWAEYQLELREKRI